MLAAYRLVAGLAGPAMLRWRLARGREDAGRIGERRGIASRARPAGPLVWVHGASVGEAASALGLIGRLQAERPGLAVLVTSGTRASAELMARRLPAGAVHQFVPVDAPAYVERFLDHWRPDLGLFIESEIWPALVSAAGRRGLPLALLNARLSARSARRWAMAPALARRLVGSFALCLAQDGDSAVRLAGLGAARVEVIGNLKAAMPPPPVDDALLAALRRAAGGRPLWLAASTHPGEEEAALAAHAAAAARHPGLLTIIVPRHPDRGAAIAALAGSLPAPLPLARRSAGELPAADTAIYLADTLGELGSFYALAPLVFVGGSLTPVGGHNPMEPAGFGRALLHGPDMSKNRAFADRLATAGASRLVGDAGDLAEAVATLLGEPATLARMGAAAAAVAAEDRAVLDRIMAALSPLLPAADARA